MAELAPFAAYRYVLERVGSLNRVITQPYDKISPGMLARYRSLSPYNLAHVIKPAPLPSGSAIQREPDSGEPDSGERFSLAGSPDYQGAAARLREWQQAGVLARDPRPAVYPYFQTYTVPGTGDRLTRRALIAAGRLEEYEAGVVFRHEQTLAGPKQDRLELLRATRAHCELIFMLHDDPEGRVAALLDRASAVAPVAGLRDEYGDEHTVWRVDEPASIEAFRQALAGKKLLIADGHHRYETALAFRRECPAADRVLVALVSMGTGLTILPTHRLLRGVPNFSRDRFLAAAARYFEISEIEMEQGRRSLAPNVLGACFTGHPSFFLLRLRPTTDLAALLPEFSPDQRRLDVVLLHQLLLRLCLGIDEEAIRQEKHLEYFREFEKGLEGVRVGAIQREPDSGERFSLAGAQACFFLHPVGIAEVRGIAFGGGVLPQKTTDFYPKMLSGMVILPVEG